MKVTLTEDKLNSLIYEAIAGKLLEMKVKKMVAEELRRRLDESKDGDGRKSDSSMESKRQVARRSQVESFFKGKGDDKQNTAINNAFYAYRLFGVAPKKGYDTLEMKNARSKFAKKLNHDENEAGYPMSFSTEEVTKLYSLITSSTKL